MEKGKTKKSSVFIVRDHYLHDGARAKDLVEKEMYKRIMNNLG